MTKLNKMTFAFLGLFAVTLIVADPAHANNFSSIAKNMTTSVASLPTLLAALSYLFGLLLGVLGVMKIKDPLSYLFGLLLGVLGVMKIKDHVENPGQTPLKDGAIRLAAGGALFAIPILYEAAKNTIGSGTATTQASLTGLTFP